ncbi:SDR family oxidoreductase [Mesorhizobium sp. BAC0120]|uniref:SDR family oxidoreductase n=1 Tax=Mesorhizobium sp. BAC0120 TaxID=3090670 RepID=UPI00298C51E7|nr:SDR family oxidoreductase [Mesorhizobium sp. BAC0120]MDW6026204.1 SDR family oxidoreductase [Mesorhizobium sp. BAC0120]
MIEEHTVIVGGSSGIGLATARRLLAQGMQVTITGRSEDRLNRARQELSGEVAVAAFDATQSDEVRRFFDDLGAFDHLVLSVTGRKGIGQFATLDLAEVRSGYDEKVWPQLFCAQQALPNVRKEGSITFVSAVSAQMSAPGLAGVAAINGALLTVVPILAKELKPLRVNAVAPGVINTPWWDFLPQDQREAAFADYARRTPVGRIGEPDDVAKSIAYLITNSFVTGQVLTCDGGLQLAA